MRQVIAILLISVTVGCALKPAPITTLDVREAIAKGAEPKIILKDIEERSTLLKRKTRNFNIAIYSCLWAPVALAGPVYLGQLSARKKTRAELKSMNEKREIINTLLEDK